MMRNWDPKLYDQLSALQDLDLEARSLQNAIEDFTRKSKEEDPQIVQLKRELSEIEQRIAATVAQHQMYADTLEDIRAAVAGMTSGKPGAMIKARTRSSTEALKIEEEKLAALVHETASQLRLHDDVRQELTGKISSRARVVETQQRGPEAEIRLLLSRIEELSKQRDLATAGIPLELLRTYDRLSRSRSGIALTKLINGVCSICRMEMPTAIVSRLKLGDLIPHCPACGRLVASVEFDETYEPVQSRRAAVYVDEDEEEDEEERPRRPVPLDDDSDEEREPVAEDEEGEAGEDGEADPEGQRSPGSTSAGRREHEQASTKAAKAKRARTIAAISAKQGKSGAARKSTQVEPADKLVKSSKKGPARPAEPPVRVAAAPAGVSKASVKTVKTDRAAIKPGKIVGKPPRVEKGPAAKADKATTTSGKVKASAKAATGRVKSTTTTASATSAKVPAKKAPAKSAKKPAGKPSKAPAKPVKAAAKKAPAKPVKAAAKKAPAKPVKAAAKPVKAPAKPVKAPAKPAKGKPGKSR